MIGWISPRPLSVCMGHSRMNPIHARNYERHTHYIALIIPYDRSEKDVEKVNRKAGPRPTQSDIAINT